MQVDVLAIGAHPDDIELIIGGTVAKLVRQGKRVAVLDLTRGEMGTRGSPETRAEEARKASKILGIVERTNLDLGDGMLQNTLENRVKVMEQIRRLRPTIVLTHHWEDLHPDHCTTAEIVKSIMYPLGMKNFPSEGDPYRPNEFLFFMGHFPFDPDLIVDVSDDFDTKLKAIHCYESQLFKPGSGEPQTRIAQPDFVRLIESRARHYGSLILRKFGEPFAVRRPVPVDDLVEHYRPFTKI